MPQMLFFALLVFAAAFCVVRMVADIRTRRYWWAAAALISAIGILTAPTQTHAVKIELPVTQ